MLLNTPGLGTAAVQLRGGFAVASRHTPRRSATMNSKEDDRDLIPRALRECETQEEGWLCEEIHEGFVCFLEQHLWQRSVVTEDAAPVLVWQACR